MVTDEQFNRAHRYLMGELLVICQPDRGDVFSFMDDHKDILRGTLEAALSSAPPVQEPVAWQTLTEDGTWKECSYFVAYGWGNELAPGCRPLYTTPQPVQPSEEDDLIAAAWTCDKWPKWLHDIVNEVCDVADKQDMSSEQAHAFAALLSLRTERARTRTGGA